MVELDSGFLRWLSPFSGNFIVLIIIFAFDKALSSRKARWFSVHAFANFLVVATSIQSVIVVCKDPLNAMDSRVYNDESVFGNASPWPIYVVNTVHIYHMLAFSDLTSAEYFHHLMFIPSVGFLGQYYKWGALCNFLSFFISGLPGGLDYVMLCMVKHRVMNVMLQKRICAALNTWLRAPCITYECAIMWIAFIYGKSTVPSAACLIVAVLSWFNAQYYCKMSVTNYAITHVLGHVEERISVTTGMSVPAWGKEAKKPQSTMS